MSWSARIDAILLERAEGSYLEVARCTREGCSFTREGVTLREWLPIRDKHYREAHDDYRPPKRKARTIRHKAVAA